MRVVGWATDVNQKIIDETTFSIGDGGRIKDSSSTGYEDERATALASPDKYKVVMYFDWGGKGSEFQTGIDANGFTEYERFVRWYKFKTQKGANPFWFPSITRSPIDNLISTDDSRMSLYKIDSALQISKSGYSMKVSMDWKEVYSGIISIPEIPLEIIRIDASNGRLDVICNQIPYSVPVITNFDLYIKEKSVSDWGPAVEATTLKQKDRIIQMSFPLKDPGFTYEVKLIPKGSGLEFTDTFKA